jgi:hypothetical protein
MTARGRWTVLGVCLVLAAITAYFFAGEANRPGVTESASGEGAAGENPTPTTAPSEARGLAAPVPAAGPAATPALPNSAATGSVPEGHVRFSGRVVRAKDVPSPGATLVVRLPGQEERAYAADAEGRFVFLVERSADERAYGLLVVQDAAHNVGERLLYWGAGYPSFTTARPSEVDLGDVFTFATSSLDVVAREASGATSETEIWVSPSATPVAVPMARVRTDAQGRGRVEGLRAQSYFVVAFVPGRSRGTAFAVVPRESPDPVEVRLEPVRDVVVTVEEEGTGAPIPGAEVALREMIRLPDFATDVAYAPVLTIPPTGPDGRTTIAGVSAKAVLLVSAVAPGFAGLDFGMRGRRGEHLTPEATSITVRLPRLRRVEWPVEAGEVPVPPDGTVIRLRSSAGSGTSAPPAEARMEAGRLVADGFAPEHVHAVATAPDGSTANLYAENTGNVGNPTKFLRRRTILVRLTWSDGSPAVGVAVYARNQGNNPMCAAVPTDAEGRTALDDLEVQQADVCAGLAKDDVWGGRRIGTCDLQSGDGRVEVVLPRVRLVVARVYLDGVPGLPPGIAALSGQILDEEDEANGILHLRIWPPAEGAPVKLYFRANGWLFDPVDLPPSSGSGPSEVRVDAHAAGSVRVETTRPADGRVRLSLERWDPATQSWRAGGFDSQAFGRGQAQMDPEGRWILPTVAPGRYRVRDAHSGATSEEFDVHAGPEPTRVRFDLSAIGLVKGQVVVPEGQSAEGILIRRSDAPVPQFAWDAPGGSTRTDAQGRFQLRLPSDRDVELVPWHLFLVPAPDGGRARVRGGASDVTLRMVSGPVARLALDREPKSGMRPGNPPSIHLWNGKRLGPPIATGKALVESTTIRFGNFEPGRYTVMFDLPDYAPILLEDVALGAGETDLGAVRLSDGTSLVFEVRVPAGQSAPRVHVSARSLGETPEYQRWGEVGATGRLPGLGRGRFRVTAGPTMGGGLLYDKEIEVDGTTDITILLESK